MPKFFGLFSKSKQNNDQLKKELEITKMLQGGEQMNIWLRDEIANRLKSNGFAPEQASMLAINAISNYFPALLTVLYAQPDKVFGVRQQQEFLTLVQRFIDYSVNQHVWVRDAIEEILKSKGADPAKARESANEMTEAKIVSLLNRHSELKGGRGLELKEAIIKSRIEDVLISYPPKTGLGL